MKIFSPNKLSFRKKIFFSQLILLILFMAIFYPLVGKSVHQIVRTSTTKLPDIDQMTEALTQNFQLGFLIVGGSILLFFMLLTWLIFFRMSIPIQTIINAIKPYQQTEILPRIPLDKPLGGEDDFTRLAQTLNSLSERIQNQLQMGKDFVANASHELRTPITIIKGFAETLQDMPKLPPKTIAEMTEKIVRNCERMESLVKNLLALADIENFAGAHLQKTDLVSLIENCKHLLLSVHSEVHFTFEKSNEEISISADPGLLELAIINLLENAVKYSPSPAQILVTLEAHKNEVLIKIADKGIGIPPEDVEHIFERFYTVDKARSRRLGGAGLGLSIVKTVIQKHHGLIHVTSHLKQGTTFTISLPNI